MFAIRHKPTGRFLPNGQGASGRGFTHVEPTNDPRCPPRLFVSEQAARSALVWWLGGTVEVKIRSHGMFEDEPDPEWIITPVEGRKAENMQIVPARLQFMCPKALAWRTIP